MESLRSLPMGVRLAEILRDRIIRGGLGRGSHLVEDVLAEQFDVSRGPVRDALRILTGEGLVSPGRRGVFVNGFSSSDIDEVYSLRLALETTATERAVALSTAGDWAPAALSLGAMERAAAAGDWQAFASNDMDFHQVFYDLSAHSRVQAVWQQYRPTVAAIIALTNEADTDLRPAAVDHERLLNAARAGGVDTTLDLLRAHLAGSRTRMLKILDHRWS